VERLAADLVEPPREAAEHSHDPLGAAENPQRATLGPGVPILFQVLFGDQPAPARKLLR